MNPETKFTKKVRSLWHKTYSDLKTYKHSDRFHGGVADLELIMPSGPGLGMTAWIEFKYIKRVAKRRVAGVTELQKIYLEEHHDAGIPSYVMIGTDAGVAMYSIENFNGYVYSEDIRPFEHVLDLITYIRARYS